MPQQRFRPNPKPEPFFKQTPADEVAAMEQRHQDTSEAQGFRHSFWSHLTEGVMIYSNTDSDRTGKRHEETFRVH